MIDHKLISKNKDELKKLLKFKDPAIDIDKIDILIKEVNNIDSQIDTLRHNKKVSSKKIGSIKSKGEDSTYLENEVKEINNQISELEIDVNKKKEILTDLLLRVPNVPFNDIKKSLDPKENVITKIHKEKPSFKFIPKNHLELNENLQLFDFPKGSKLTGTGWPLYKNIGAQLEWALINYMLEIHLKNGFTQYMTPFVVKEEAMQNVGQLPKFRGQTYELKEEEKEFHLIPTAEVALNGMYANEILKEEELPIKCVSYSPCFRREAGAAGKNERGLIRVHQFNKVELFSFTKPEESETIFNQMIASAEEILINLDIHFRHSLLVTGDMSFSAAKTIDLEVWLPGQDRYYEVSSISNCTDFQARRSKIRYKSKDGKLSLVHTLNGSGLATPRLMVAILENNQQEDGSIYIPKPLQKYLNKEYIR